MEKYFQHFLLTKDKKTDFKSKEYLSIFDTILLIYQVSCRQWRTDGSIYWGGQWESVSLLIKPMQHAKERNIIGDRTFEDIRTQKVLE